MNPYFTKQENKIEITETGQNTLDYFGLTVGDLKKMSQQQLISHCKKFSDILNDGKVTKSEGGTNECYRSTFDKSQKGKPFHYGDSGSFSRYFDLDAWFAERIKKLPEEVQKVFPCLLVPKPAKSEKETGLQGFEIKARSQSRPNSPDDSRFPDHDCYPKAKNNHPTCKPIKLGCYLTVLGSREGDLVLDPFCGSGSFCISALIEKRNFIGIELDESFCKIAEARIRYWQSKTKTLFDSLTSE